MFSIVRPAFGRICVVLAICAAAVIAGLLSAGAASATGRVSPNCALAVTDGLQSAACGPNGTTDAAPVVIVSPVDTTGYMDGTVQFTAAATASVTPTVSWEYSFDNGTTWNPAGQFTTTYTLGSLTLGENGDLVRAGFTNPSGTTYTSSARLTVLAAQPVATLDTTTLSFGYEQVGFVADSQAVTVTNTGTRPLAFGDALSNTARFLVFGDTCSRQALAPDASCSISIAFAPDTDGTITGVLVIPDNAADSQQFVGLAGIGGRAPTLGADATVSGTVGVAVSYPLSVTGSPTPAVSLIAGALPPGLTLGSDNVISGAPTRAGTYQATVEASNGLGTPAHETLTFGIAARGVLTLSPGSVTEGNRGKTAMTFTYRLVRPAAATGSFHFATRNDTAGYGSDYVRTSGTVTVAAGTQVGQIVVQVKGDRVVEPDDQFTLALSQASGLVLTTHRATGTIVNDD